MLVSNINFLNLLYVMLDPFPLLCFYSWHDAGTYDAKTKTGGANGSIRTEKESSHGANAGIHIALGFCGMP